MATAADVAIVAAWLVVLGHNAVLAARGVARTPHVGRWIAGLVLASGLAVVGTHLERASGGRWWVPAPVAAAAAIVTVAGATLHVRARSVLAGDWSASAESPSQLVERGPYARVRHPLYGALLLMAMGSVAAHPSVATVAAGVGFVVGLGTKVAREERALAVRFGSEWETYRRRVPLLVPSRRAS